jgi:hypothetical protein
VQAVAGLCLLLFIVTVTGVGVRMLLLARRSHGRPELLMGTGMVLVGAIGYPGGIASGFGRPVHDLILPLWLGSALVTQAGITLIYAFTWQVFRPETRWGRALVVIGAASMLGGLVGAAVAMVGAPPDASSSLVARDWMFLSMVGYSGCFLWSAIEGLVQYRMARRRVAIGLADPVVANRFWLWGLFGLAATGVNVVSAIGNGLGVDPSRTPFVLVPMGVLGFVASAVMYLAFLPPPWYLGFVRARTAPRRA